MEKKIVAKLQEKVIFISQIQWSNSEVVMYSRPSRKTSRISVEQMSKEKLIRRIRIMHNYD